jgi:hypothetical protein
VPEGRGSLYKFIIPKNMNMNLQILIEKYYQGETSLDEEAEMRVAFSSDEIKKEEPCTQLIFNAFVEEKNVRAPSSAKIFSPKSTKFLKKWAYLSSGAVACFLIVVSLFFYKYMQANNAYVIINGVRINDEKLALQYIKESFEEEERITNMGLEQLYEMGKTEDELNEIANNIIHN